MKKLTTDVAGTANAMRNHWQVENKIHRVLDVTFGEDDSRIHRGDRNDDMLAAILFGQN